jgi:hypothetical protein
MDEGLGAAIEGLAEASPVPMRVERVPEERFPAEVEAAAYQVVADLVARGSGPVRVDAWRTAGSLVLEVLHAGQADEEVEDAADRVRAADGSLTVIPTEMGVMVRAEIPCAS